MLSKENQSYYCCESCAPDNYERYLAILAEAFINIINDISKIENDL